MKVEYYESGKLKYFEGTTEEWNRMIVTSYVDNGCVISLSDVVTEEKTIERQSWMEEANWIAKDEDGSVWTYSEKPQIDGGRWTEGEGEYCGEVSHYAGDMFQFIPWRDSLHRIV